MLQCGFVRSNFSLAIRVLPAFVDRARQAKVDTGFAARRALTLQEGAFYRRLRRLRGAGAGSGNRTRILSLEGCCTTIVLYPPANCGAPQLLDSVHRARGGGSRTRTCEGVRQRIYSPPPLPLGTFPQRVRSSLSGPSLKRLPPGDAGGLMRRLQTLETAPAAGGPK